MKYSVITFGCRVNQADSLGFEEAFLRTGAEPGTPETADVVVVNTCSVTASADQGARQTIRRVARLNPSARVIVTGCYASREAGQVAELPNVSAVVPNTDKYRLLRLIQEPLAFPGSADAASEARVRGADNTDADGPCGAAIEPGVAGRTAFTLRVQTGCAEPCSYCIIPETRGAPRSEPVEWVLAEVDRVVSLGFREVILTGVHLGSYGRDLPSPRSLFNLVQALDRRYRPEAPGLSPVRFRISSLEPMDCTPELIELIAESPCVAPHFHLPLQHASAAVLEAMRRPYRLAQYRELIARIRSAMPHASIGTDVIVGFPGETEADFEVLGAYLTDSSLSHVHVFPYSDRPGTAASKLGARPDGVDVKRRGARIREVGAALQRAFLASQVGTEHLALTLEDGTLALTGNYLKVRIARGHRRNDWVRVRVDSVVPTIAGTAFSGGLGLTL